MLGRLLRIQRDTHRTLARSYATTVEKSLYKHYSATLNLPTCEFQPWLKNPVEEEKKIRQICCDYINEWNTKKVIHNLSVILKC